MNNPPAFPVGLEAFGEDKTGMTLRDYFAAKAMQGIFMGSIEWSPTYKHPDDASLEVFKDIAQDSYAMADAMLKAREA